MKQQLNEVEKMQKIAGILKENKEPVKVFYFGYDLDNIQEVQDYVESKYKTANHNDSRDELDAAQAVLYIGYGDDTMNAMEVHDSALLNDLQLMELINACDGKGEFDEDNYSDDEEEDDEE